MNRLNLPLRLLISLIPLFNFHCNQTPSYCATKHLSHPWNYLDTLTLTFTAPDPNQTYELTLLLEVLPSYPYQNLYLRFELLHDQSFLSESTPNFLLFDPYGKPYGKTHWLSKAITYHFTLKENLQFPQPGTYTIRLQQWMRTDSLPSIQKVSLCLKPTQ